MAEGDLEAARLAGARVLVAEDEFVIALEIEAALRDLGCVVLGPAASVADAVGLLERERPDAALLDVELLDGPVTPVAEACAARGVPFALATGYDQDGIPGPALADAPYLAKPFAVRELRRVLASLLAGRPASGADEP